MKLIKIFSDHTGEEARLYSVPRFQKEFNSKSQKELRRRLDLERGLEYSKLDPTKEYPKDIVDEGIRRGRSLNSQPIQTKNLKERAKELKKAKRIKFLKKGAKATAIGIGTVGVGVGIQKAVDNHKEKKLLKEYREQLKTYSIFSESSKQISLEDIYKNILNPIILESDKVYGKKSLYIPRLLEKGETKEGKTLLIGQHPDADLRSDSCYEIFDGLWKDSSGKYWTEKSGFLGRKTWKEVEDPKRYMSEIYRGFNISSKSLSKVCGNLSKAIYENSLDKVKGNSQYWKLPEIKYFSIFSGLFPKKNEVVPNYLGLPVKISGKINQENLGKEIWEDEMKVWEYSPLNSKYKKTDFQKFLKNLKIEKVPKKDWLGDDEELTVYLKDDSYLGWWKLYLDKNGKISDISFND